MDLFRSSRGFEKRVCVKWATGFIQVIVMTSSRFDTQRTQPSTRFSSFLSFFPSFNVKTCGWGCGFLRKSAPFDSILTSHFFRKRPIGHVANPPLFSLQNQWEATSLVMGILFRTQKRRNSLGKSSRQRGQIGARHPAEPRLTRSIEQYCPDDRIEL